MSKKLHWLSAAVIGMSAFLFGCSAAFVPVEGSSEVQTEPSKEETEAAEREMLYQPVPETLRQKMIEDLEAFDQERSYTEMDQEKADACGEEILDAYDFIGRETEDGYGYVLGFRNGDGNPLDGLSIYSLDDVIEADRWNEDENIFEKVYTFKNIDEIYYTETKDMLFFIPKGMEEPEELKKAFEYRFCGGEDGVKYLESVKTRGVRMSPPENGGYLSVRKFLNGELFEEYIPLTKEEEQEIIQAEETIDPEVYGGEGIMYTASPEIYEEADADLDRITAPALKFAEEKCEFQTASPEDIRDLAAAEMTVYPGRGQDGIENSKKEDQDSVSETLNDPEKLKTLETVLSGAAAGEYEACPYDGILTLTKTDGTTITVSLASDGCDTMVFGSYSFYQTADGELEKLWDLFPEMKKEIEQEAK